MTLQQLRYVTAIAETGTLSEAARRFYIAQPSLTASLRELEEELGLTIFRRTNRGAVLTPEGEEFLGYARQVLAQMELSHAKLETRVYTLPKKLDEEVARLHLGRLGVKLTRLTQQQADYIGVSVDGPYKTELYRY